MRKIGTKHDTQESKGGNGIKQVMVEWWVVACIEKNRGIYSMEKVTWEVSHLVHDMHKKLPTTKIKGKPYKKEREREIELGGC